MKIKYFVYRLKWNLAYYLNLSPTHIDIELTSNCNLTCEFCHRIDQNFKIGNMKKELVFSILKEAKKIGIKSVKFNWRGESLLYKDLLYCFSYAKSLGFFILMNTNLSGKINNNIIKAIALFVDVIKVSIDSSKKNIYERIRKGSKFHNTLSNLYLLNSYRKLYKKSNIIISRRETIFTEDNEEFLNFFKNNFYKFDIKPAIKRNKNNIYTKQKLKRKYCGHPARRLVISWDGNVYPCCVSYAESQELYLGNLNDKNMTLKKIWNGDKRKKINNNLQKGKIMYKTCIFCTSRDAYE